jgi:hypothetical protein
MRNRLTFSILTFSILLLASSCSFLFEPAPTSVLSGFVANSTSGEPVQGTRVTVQGATSGFVASGVTNMTGMFQLRVEPDVYEVNLSKDGYASSRVIGVNAYVPTNIEIIQREAIDPRLLLDPPNIILTGVAEGDELQGPIPYRVDVESPNDIRSIYVAIGKVPGSGFMTAPRHFFNEASSTGDQITDPEIFGVRGSTEFNVVVYDMNDNRTHLITRIMVIPAEGLVDPAKDLSAMSVTLGKQIGFFEVSGEAAPNNTNLYVQLDWGSSQNATATGYNLYRSFDGANFEQIATVNPTQLAYKDGSPELFPGRPVWYKVTTMRGGEESVASNIAMTRPLPSFDVNLVGPTDEERGVGISPSFEWKPTRTVSPYHLYGAVLRDTLTGENSIWLTPDPPDFLMNTTEYTWNQDGQYDGAPYENLQPHRVYEWEVVYAVAVDDIENATAVSIGINRFGINDDRFPYQPIGIGSTDSFEFTTGNQ